MGIYITADEVRNHGGASALASVAPTAVNAQTINNAIAATIAEIDKATGELFCGTTAQTRFAELRRPSQDLRLPRFRSITRLECRRIEGGNFIELPRLAEDGTENWATLGIHLQPAGAGTYGRIIRRRNVGVFDRGEYHITGDWGWAEADVPAQIKWAALSQANYMILHADATGGQAGVDDLAVNIGGFYWHVQAWAIVGAWRTGERAAGIRR